MQHIFKLLMSDCVLNILFWLVLGWSDDLSAAADSDFGRGGEKAAESAAAHAALRESLAHAALGNEKADNNNNAIDDRQIGAKFHFGLKV